MPINRRNFLTGTALAVSGLRPASAQADYIAELMGFPGTKYADQVDSTTQALDYIRTTYASDNWINTTDWEYVLGAIERAARSPTAVSW